MKLLLTISFLLVLLKPVVSQTFPDSVSRQVLNIPDDEEKIDYLLNYLIPQPPSREYVKWLDSVKKHTELSPALLMKVQLQLSRQYYHLNKNFEARNSALLLRQYAQKFQDSVFYLSANNNLGLIYYRLSKYDSVLYYLNDSYEYLQKSKDTTSIGGNLNNLGLYYLRTKDYDRSRSHFQQLIKLGNQASPKYMKALLGAGYTNLGLLYKDKNMLDSALYFFNKKLELVPDDVATFNELGSIARRLGNYKEAIQLYKKVLNNGLQNSNNLFAASASNNLSVVYNEMREFEKALYYAEEGEKFSKLLGRLDWIRIALEEQKDALSGLGNYKVALQVMEKLEDINDSIKSQEVQNHMAELETSYQLKEKTSALKLSEANNALNLQALQEEKIKTKMALWVIILSSIIIILVVICLVSLNKAKAKLLESNNIKDRFFAIITHDLKGSLSGFSGLGEILNSNVESRQYDQVGELSLLLVNEAKRLESLLDKLLTWAMSQLKQIHFKKEEIQVNELLQDLEEEFHFALKNKGINLDYSGVSCKVMADSDSVTFILRNLISNALKFSQKGDEIMVQCLEKGKRREILVIDNGKGMNENTLNSLFRADKKITSLGTEGEQGNGLGLLLCNEFALRNDGKLQVKSELGKGSVFILELPGINS